MSRHNALQLLNKYLQGNCTQEECERIEKWLAGLNANNEWSRLSSEAKREYIENLFLDIQERIQSKRTIPSRKPRSPHRWIYRIAAAVILLTITLGGLYWLKAPDQSSQKIYSQNVTGTGIVKKIVLPDNSVAFLNSSSELRYEKGFSGKIREVYLKGEACFEVVPDPDKPFIVHCGNLDTHVLGTTFNVSAYPEDNKIQITVIKGKVSVEGLEEHSNKKLLTRNQQLTYSKGVLTTMPVSNASDYASWTTGTLSFYKSSMEDVIRVLQRTFGITIYCQNNSINSCELTGHFEKKQGLQDILKAICLSIGGEYHETKGKILIDGPGCK